MLKKSFTATIVIAAFAGLAACGPTADDPTFEDPAFETSPAAPAEYETTPPPAAESYPADPADPTADTIVDVWGDEPVGEPDPAAAPAPPEDTPEEGAADL